MRWIQQDMSEENDDAPYVDDDVDNSSYNGTCYSTRYGVYYEPVQSIIRIL